MTMPSLYRLLSLIVLLSAGLFLAAPSSHSYLLNPDQSLIGKPAPELVSDGVWLNSTPLKLADLRGKVVVLHFWTFACYNCRNTIPYVKAWHEKFKSQSVSFIGIHTPEFEREKNVENVKRELLSLGVAYSVVTDNDFRLWNLYKQEYWPCVYLVDKKGVVRYIHIGEGAYSQTESQISALLNEP
jgi:thiol-disulfide isomerase/thioredoxin